MNQVNHEKSFTQSKKFVFAFFGVIVLATLAIVGYLTTATVAAMVPVYLTVVVTIGFIVVGIVLGQTILDKYVRLAEITSQKLTGKKEDDKDVDKDPK